jgi:L-2,4-diaminobutyrate decarboxylase
MKIEVNFLSADTRHEAERIFNDAISTGLNFKLQENVRSADIDKLQPANFIDEIPENGKSISAVQKEFYDRFLPYCYNFASPRFMGFPDAGNSIAAIAGNITADFLQQNLINQSFCSPSGTFAEISVIRWLRSIVGYKNTTKVQTVFQVGGIITGGGTTSNTIGMLLARENHVRNTMQSGVMIDDNFYLVVPKGIGHYSVKSAQMWIGCGHRLLEVETKDFKYDLAELEETLKQYKGKIMALVAYAGDSRTMTVDNFNAIADLVDKVDPNIWLHADACHGFSLGFSDTLKHKIKGIERFNSITTDPHKVMNSPYTISALLVRDPAVMKTISSTSDLIMQEDFAFGQITPFLGSRPWMSLKLWFVMKNLGRKGFGQLIDDRHAIAVKLAGLVKKHPSFVLVNSIDINAVAFMYASTSLQSQGTTMLNEINKKIHKQIILDGKYHLHQFSVPDSAGVLRQNEIIYPLRFMSGNPLLKEHDLTEMLQYVESVAQKILQDEDRAKK